MNCLDRTWPSAAENLAGDEALLDWAEEADSQETLRFWEPADTFVVVGYANRVATEANGAACAALGIPVYRRCTGGGTVLQGPGCLNYALILRAAAEGPLASITGANRFIMERHRAALQALIGLPVRVRGHTDLTIEARKFSGNAQRRRRRCLLFHGTFLLHLDLDLVEHCLAMPSQEPDYRGHRRHRDFVANLGVGATAVKTALRQAWGADEVLAADLGPRVERLAEERYRSAEWNQRV
jgi:lipoate-protein ligase A